MSVKKLSLLVLTVFVSACVSDGPRDIAGKRLDYGDAVVIDRQESRVRFVGENAPVVRSTVMRWRDNSIREERIYFEAKPTGRVYVQFARTVFGGITNKYLQDLESVREGAQEACSGPSEPPRRGLNENGDFIYATCDVGGRFRCLAALQGLGKQYGVGAEPGFKAIVKFQYCAPESESQILRRLASIRIVK